MSKGKYIALPAADKRQLAEAFDISLQAVYDALNHKTQSKKAVAIRAAALNRGGREYVPQPLQKK